MDHAVTTATAALNPFDLGVLIIVGLSALMSFYRGFVKEAVSLVTWIGASIITMHALPMGTHYLAPYIKSKELATAVASVSVFLIALILISIFTGLLLKAIKPATKVGILDNLLGLCFGVARGVLIVSIIYFVMTFVLVPMDYPEWVKTAKTRPYIAEVSQSISKFAPTYLDDLIAKKKDNEKEATPDTTTPASNTLPKLDHELKDKLPSLDDLQQRIHDETQNNEKK